MYRFFTSRDIHPTGWLKQQLEIEARGLAAGCPGQRLDRR